MNKFVEVTCYIENLNELSEETRKKFYASNCDTSYIEKNVELNKDHIIYLEEANLLRIVDTVDYKEKKIKCNSVVATMTDGKRFYIKANSIPELKLKTIIEGKGEFE